MAKKTKTAVFKIYKVKNCKDCPNCDRHLGYATDYFCKAANDATIAGYVEWESEGPQDHKFPAFCPLKSASAKS